MNVRFQVRNSVRNFIFLRQVIFIALVELIGLCGWLVVGDSRANIVVRGLVASWPEHGSTVLGPVSKFAAFETAEEVARQSVRC